MTGTRVISILLGVAIIFTLFRIPQDKQGFEFDSFQSYNEQTAPLKPLREWLTELSYLHPNPEQFLSIFYYFENGVFKGDWGIFDGLREFLNVGIAPLQMTWSLLKTLLGFYRFIFVREPYVE